MAHISRLVCNRLGWTKPSGIDCKNQNAIHGHLHEAVYGFGFEEWLFRGFNFTSTDGESYYLGYIESFSQNGEIIGPYNPLYLSTTLYPNGIGVCALQTKRMLGALYGCQRLTTQEKLLINNNGFNGGTFQGMRDELKTTLINDPRQLIAIQKFDTHLEEENIFNVKFTRGCRFNVPLPHVNWEYLVANRGLIIGLLPENFNLNEIPNQNIVDYINTNGGNIPQILPPL